MFRKIITTVYGDGRVETQKVHESIAAEDVEADMAAERRQVTRIAHAGSPGRIETVEQTMTTLVVVYVSGTVKVTHWVAG